MKRVAALFAVLGALGAAVPSSAPASTAVTSDEDVVCVLLMLKLCE
jgi:hypothetical protein